jgi:DHA2 family multidrug resistance protein
VPYDILLERALEAAGVAYVAGFTLASALCGSATSLAQLLIYRVLQGVCGAALVPLSLSVLLHINPRERHARA